MSQDAESEHKFTLLIVDDDEVFRPRLARAFETRGFEVWHTADARSAADIVREHDPEFGIIDLRISTEFNGLQVLKELLELSPHLRAIILTGYGSIATAVDAVKLGAVSYLTKPADADEILHALTQKEPALTSGEVSYEEAPSLARAEWEHINRVLSDCGGNISQAARILGIHRRSLQRKLGKHPPQK